MAIAKTKSSTIREVKKAMEELGIYKKEYDRIIDIYAGLLHQYQMFEEEFISSGYKIEEEYTNKAGATNMRKVPLYGAMESIRKDIATYSDRLCLNPKAIENITVDRQKKSALEIAMMEIGKDK